tara:strand:- start:190 stop:339 length:150 start_codon:yes stop_codon:yes gene_type:complete
MKCESLLADLMQEYDVLESLHKVAVRERDYEVRFYREVQDYTEEDIKNE